MAITNYGDLKSEIAGWLARSDQAARIPTFIAMAESRMWNGGSDLLPGIEITPLRTREMETTATLTVANDTATLPADFLELRRLYWINAGNDSPTSYTIEDGKLVFPDVASSTIQIAYYRSLPAMSADSDTNAILLRYPGIYLHGALTEGFSFARNAEQAQTHLQRFVSLIRGANRSDRAARFPSFDLVASTPGVA
jgi:hypothetical protein